MNELHLFAGTGGGILGGMLLGHTTVCAVEIEPFCRKVLLQRQRDGILPRFPIWDDVNTFDGNPWRGKVDIVCGGFPCQDISIAGKGDGIEGGRSSLWGQMDRIIGEVRPKYVFVENSPMLVGRGLTRVLSDLAQMGYDEKWCCMGGFTVGGCSDGKRIWILANEANANRGKTPSVPDLILDKEGASRREFNRAISSCSSEEAHAERLRDTDGMARDVERLQAIGNGQRPLLAATAWRTLND